MRAAPRISARSGRRAGPRACTAPRLWRLTRHADRGAYTAVFLRSPLEPGSGCGRAVIGLSANRATLQPDRRHLLERFEIVDAARKVVGVGSVGTRAFIVLLQGRDAQDPLFLQIKEATASVLEAYLPKSRYRQHGERVVHGQRMMQAASDIYLGWTKGQDVNRNFYWRQLRNMKGSALVELMTPLGLTFYARICGWTLARAHARSRQPGRHRRIPR